METNETFVPVTIGTSPSGVVWTAYKPQHVEPMRRKLAKLWEAEERVVRGLSPSALEEAASIGLERIEGHGVRGSVVALTWLADRCRRMFWTDDHNRIVRGVRGGA